MEILPEISVCIFTLNPEADVFRQVISGLKSQTFDSSRYEIVVVDNGSELPVAEIFRPDLTWHPAVRFVVEPQRGYVYANRRFIEEAKYPVIVILGDDCILAPDYLDKANSILSEHPDVAVLTGVLRPQHPAKADKLMRQFLAVNYWGTNFTGYVETKIKTKFTVAMRGSAGMAVRKEIGQAFLRRFWIYPEMMEVLRQAHLPFNLHYEDLDLAMHALHMNYKIARSGDLQLVHVGLEDEVRFGQLLRRMYLTGFFQEFFFMRWNWYTYKRSSWRGWARLVRQVIYPIWPLAPWLARIAMVWGGLRARWFLINHQDLIHKVNAGQGQ